MARKPLDGKEAIAAIATAPGRGGIGVVRVSGPNLFSLASQLCGKPPEPRRAHLSTFRDAAGGSIDQGILLYFPGPHSFTGEDVLELQGHGGPVVMQLLLQRCLELGARLAQPGEFTQRAFLNDKLDLAQAEAVADLIDASSVQAARSAVRSLSGEFSKHLHQIVDLLIELRMLIEATLDFPEEEIEAETLLRKYNIPARIEHLLTSIISLQKRAQQGSLLRRGLQVVLVGPPNVGKSSLLNRLAGEERAIVTDIAGTTRDALREMIQIEGVPLHIIDTAGLRQTEDTVEKLGIERSWREIERADVILQLIDARQGYTQEDQFLAQQFPEHLTRLVLHNKADLTGEAMARTEEGGRVHLRLSALSGEGLSILQEELLRIAGWEEHGEDIILARERHLAALQLALDALRDAQLNTTQLELMAEDLRKSQMALCEITGEFTADDLLGAIFSRFCIGK